MVQASGAMRIGRSPHAWGHRQIDHGRVGQHGGIWLAAMGLGGPIYCGNKSVHIGVS
jgi:hypothetical protein